MRPLLAAPLVLWLVPCLSPAIAQVVVKLESPKHAHATPQASGVLRVADAMVQRQLGTNVFPGAGPAIDLGLQWLLAHQDQDGRWSAERFMKHDAGPQPSDGSGNPVNDVGVTGLAVLALAREGAPGGTDPRNDAIRRAAKWLAEQQDKNGLIGAPASVSFFYGHAIATFALCAAHVATGDVPMRDAAQKGIDYIEHHRNPFGVWRYQAREGSGDSSITTWAVLALAAGQELGLQVPPAALKAATVFFDAVTDPKNGRVGYTKAGEGSSRPVGKIAKFPADRGETLTAASLMCRQALGQTLAAMPPQVAMGKDLLLEKLPEWRPDEGRIDHCYWLFGTEVMRGAEGEARKKWGDKLVDALVKGQRPDGACKGSSDPVDPWGEEGGRVYATAMAVLALQALYGGGATPAKSAVK